jgi:alpha-N-arabinofuranosidase
VADYNDFNSPNVVAPKEYKDAKLKKGILTLKVPAKSIIVLTIK